MKKKLFSIIMIMALIVATSVTSFATSDPFSKEDVEAIKQIVDYHFRDELSCAIYDKQASKDLRKEYKKLARLGGTMRRLGKKWQDFDSKDPAALSVNQETRLAAIFDQDRDTHQLENYTLDKQTQQRIQQSANQTIPEIKQELELELDLQNAFVI